MSDSEYSVIKSDVIKSFDCSKAERICEWLEAAHFTYFLGYTSYRIQPLVYVKSCTQESFTPTGSAPKTICPLALRLGNVPLPFGGGTLYNYYIPWEGDSSTITISGNVIFILSYPTEH